VSLRWRIALGFALVALATAAVIALATPPIVTQGFNDVDTDFDSGQPATTALTSPAGDAESGDTGEGATTPAETLTPMPAAAGTTSGQASQTTIFRLILAAIAAAAAASLLGLLAAGRLVRPLTSLEEAAAAVARGDLGSRSGLADRGDEFGQLGRTFDSMAGQLEAAEETRRRFLQDAAHELKTPLAVIDATSSAILDGVYTPNRASWPGSSTTFARSAWRRAATSRWNAAPWTFGASSIPWPPASRLEPPSGRSSYP
jgi:signal transduction histidine kinase